MSQRVIASRTQLVRELRILKSRAQEFLEGRPRDLERMQILLRELTRPEPKTNVPAPMRWSKHKRALHALFPAAPDYQQHNTP